MFSGGSGTVNDPYLIATANDFNNIRNLSGYEPEDFFYYKQVSDISLASITWTPYPFSGEYDGGAYKITDFECYTSNAALFSSVLSNSKLKNMKVIDAYIDTTEHSYGTGAILALYHNYNNTAITDCHVSGVIKSSYASALVYNNGSKTERCTADVVITANNVGFFVYDNGNDGEILDCDARGVVELADYASGFVGSNYGKIERCSTEVNITIDDGSGEGFVKSNNNLIKDCYCSGTLLVLSESSVRLSGFDDGNYGRIENCYSAIKINKPNQEYSVNRINLFSNHGYDRLHSCYVDVDSGSLQDAWTTLLTYHNDAYARGTDNKLYKCTNYQSAYEEPILEVRPIDGSRYSEFWQDALVTDSVVARTTAQMTTASNYVGWDFGNVWRIRPGMYPELIRQTKSSGQLEAMPLTSITVVN